MKTKRVIFLLLMIGIFVQIFYLGTYAVLAYNGNEIGTKIEGTQDILNEDETIIYNFINEYRKQKGLQSLQVSKELQEVAEIKARDLLVAEEFSHTSKVYGSTFDIMKENKIEYDCAGENLAGNISSKKAVEAWIHSPSHKDNIVDTRYNYTGICVVNSPIYGKIFVQLFMEK